MPPITRGPLKGFFRPDYREGSTVNLLASVIRSRGGCSPHRDLRGLPAAALARARNVVVLVVDGVGEYQVERLIRGGGGLAFFAARPRQAITTVFPATTAAAVTTFATGATPAEHGILGWYLHLPDLGLVSTILPAMTRTGSPLAAGTFDLAAYLRVPSHLDTARGRRELISWKHIPGSRYSRAMTAWTRRRSYRTLRGLERQIAAFARTPGRGVAYAYWPGYDSLCHERGCFDRRTVAHLEEIDRSLARLVRRLAGTGTALVVTADHGLVDVDGRHAVELRDIPGFYDCLAVLPSGDARQVQCFVRPAKVAAFRALVRRRLSGFSVCVSGEELLQSGVLGPGREHAALRGRVGDYILLARDGCAFSHKLPGAASEFNRGNHGGMSEKEMVVPLYVAFG